jgi:hypothetical protein
MMIAASGGRAITLNLYDTMIHHFVGCVGKLFDATRLGLFGGNSAKPNKMRREPIIKMCMVG